MTFTRVLAIITASGIAWAAVFILDMPFAGTHSFRTVCIVAAACSVFAAAVAWWLTQ